MIYKALSPYTPEDAINKMLTTLREMDAKIEYTSDRAIKAKIKLGFMSSASIQANFIEIPYGSVIEFTIPNLSEDQLVDEAFFGERVAAIGQIEKGNKVMLRINDLKARVDAVDEEEVG